jgi:hypothetical protein
MTIMKINAIQCDKCGDIVFSRARHDMRWCNCGEVAIDGGFDYTKISYITSSPKRVEIEVNATKAELYNDWNNRIDDYGLIKSK